MNSLSWLLYAAEISENIRSIGVPLAIIGILGSAFAYPMSFLAGETWSWQDAEEKAAVKKRPASIQAIAKRVALAGCLVLAVAAFAPSRNALLLIAASEVGETVIASEQVQQIGGEAGELATDSLRVLRKFINEQLAEGDAK